MLLFLYEQPLTAQGEALTALSMASSSHSAFTVFALGAPAASVATDVNSQPNPTLIAKSNPLSKTITYCVDPDWLPYEGIRDGVHIGMSAAYLAIVSQQTGLTFRLLPTESWKQTLDSLESGECQFTTMLNKSTSRVHYLSFSQVYFRSPNVLVALKEQPFLQGFENIGSRTLAIPKGYRLTEYVKRYYPKIQIVPVENERDGLLAVSQHQADIFVGSMFSVNAHIQQRGLFNLKIAGWGGPEDELRMAVTKGHEDLLPMIDRALANISEAQRLTIYQKWNNINIIDDTDYAIFWWILGGLFVVVLGLVARNQWVTKYNRQLKEKNKQLQLLKEKLERSNTELAFLSEHDPLTKLYNRNYFNKQINKNQRSPTSKHKPVSLIVMDIDHFKRINDEFGHNMGDQVLRELSTVMTSQIREQDIVARWGGEEFVILCNHSTLDEAKGLCERIAQAISTTRFSADVSVTCSFGVAQLAEDEHMLECFERADKALYQAKDLGRDRICLQG